jgi:hypothetical protein
MKALFRTAAELNCLLSERSWRYCFIGGISLQRWGQPRLTNDIDLTILTGFGQEERYVDEMLKLYNGRIPDSREFALTNRVLLLATNDGIPIDVALGGIDFEKKLVSRASLYEFIPGLSLPTCSAEDLIVLKSFADRARDWADVETIIVRQRKQLDWEYISEQLKPLCQVKESLEIIERLERLRDCL